MGAPNLRAVRKNAQLRLNEARARESGAKSVTRALLSRTYRGSNKRLAVFPRLGNNRKKGRRRRRGLRRGREDARYLTGSN